MMYSKKYLKKNLFLWNNFTNMAKINLFIHLSYKFNMIDNIYDRIQYTKIYRESISFPNKILFFHTCASILSHKFIKKYK